MSTQIVGPTKTYKSTGDLRTSQYCIVKLSTDQNAVEIASDANDNIIGVVQNKPNTGENAEVFGRWGGGTGKVKCGGSVSAGHFLTTDSSGHAVATTTLADEVFGRALQDGDTNDIIEFVPYAGQYAEVT